MKFIIKSPFHIINKLSLAREPFLQRGGKEEKHTKNNLKLSF